MTQYVLGLLFSSLVAASNHPAAAQSDTAKWVWYVEPMPEPPNGGGRAGIMAAVYQRLVLPAECRRAQFVDRVFVVFTIAPAGEVQQVEVVKSLYEPFDAAAVRAVHQLPCFRPRPVWQGCVRYVIGVDFLAAVEYSAQQKQSIRLLNKSGK